MKQYKKNPNIKDVAEISFLKLAESLTSARQTRISPVTGVIEHCTVSWPRGCNFLVEVLFEHKRIQIIPYPTQGTTRGIALDNFTETLRPNWPVQHGDLIEMVLLNHDEDNSHTISALMRIRETEL